MNERKDRISRDKCHIYITLALIDAGIHPSISDKYRMPKRFKRVGIAGASRELFVSICSQRRKSLAGMKSALHKIVDINKLEF